jgi:hypothetical protein
MAQQVAMPRLTSSKICLITVYTERNLLKICLSNLQTSYLYVVVFIHVQFPLGLLSNVIRGMTVSLNF